ncbi:hypothetical protein C1H46_010520 [Malus baccata]|uniref:Uncharacterized protein n=1 Tax=Malus baccata TaxID=106549 RepID=A0A540MYI1_MALBA|nr:hypothetical protein C1H46_010520 [Malus baccata]
MLTPLSLPLLPLHLRDPPFPSLPPSSSPLPSLSQINLHPTLIPKILLAPILSPFFHPRVSRISTANDQTEQIHIRERRRRHGIERGGGDMAAVGDQSVFERAAGVLGLLRRQAARGFRRKSGIRLFFLGMRASGLPEGKMLQTG